MSDKLINVFDYEIAAAATMDPGAHAYYAGGVGDDITLSANRKAFEKIFIKPRVLAGVSTVNTSTDVMQTPLNAPFLLAPTAMHKLAHVSGEIGSGRAAREKGLIQILSTMSSTAVEEVTALGHPVWLQLYIFRNREASEALLERAENSGCQAIVWTVDVPVLGIRENLIRAGFESPDGIPLPNIVPKGSKKHSTARLLKSIEHDFDPSLTWTDLDWLRARTRLPIWIKGILREDDARRAVDLGADGIIVSNHGGRQLDTAIPTIWALKEITAAVGDRVEILMDGGIRRGTDILKAIALGARAVLLGRAPLWGLAVNGEEGVRDVITILETELKNTMAQCGCASVSDIQSDLIYQQNPEKHEKRGPSGWPNG